VVGATGVGQLGPPQRGLLRAARQHHRLGRRTTVAGYIQLSQAAAACRIHQSELSLRPIWRQREDWVPAHIPVCFLAYVLWQTLEQWQSRAGLGRSPRIILDELGRIQSPDVVRPRAKDPSRKLRIRGVVRPDQAQALLLDRLGLRLPERLQPPPSIGQM
jgi:hypothetical protein